MLPEDKVSKLLTVVSETVLSAIKDIESKQKVKKPIGLDSIALMLKISLKDLEPIIAHLHSEGHIVVHCKQHIATKGTPKPASVSLNNDVTVPL